MAFCQCSQDPCSCCKKNFWISTTGVNTLKGCDGDPNNKPVLQLNMILDILFKNKVAQKDFWKLYPSLFPCEKEKFDKAFEKNPYLKKYMLADDTDVSDKFMSWVNKTPIYSVTLNAAPKQPVQNVPSIWPGCGGKG